jgi:hypothetical protein
MARHSIQLAWIAGRPNIASRILTAVISNLAFDQSELSKDIFINMLFSSRIDILGTCQDLSLLDNYKMIQTPLNINIIASTNSIDI